MILLQNNSEPIYIQFLTPRPGYVVPKDSEQLLDHLGSDTRFIAFFDITSRPGRANWVEQGIGIPIEVPEDVKFILVCKLGLNRKHLRERDEWETACFTGTFVSRCEAEELHRKMSMKRRRSASISSSEDVEVVSGPEPLSSQSSQSRSPTKATSPAADSDGDIIYLGTKERKGPHKKWYTSTPWPGPFVYVCQIAPRIQDIVNLPTEAFLSKFVDKFSSRQTQPPANSTRLNIRTEYRKAAHAEILERFVQYGKTEEGRWSKLRTGKLP